MKPMALVHSESLTWKIGKAEFVICMLILFRDSKAQSKSADMPARPLAFDLLFVKKISSHQVPLKTHERLTDCLL